MTRLNKIILALTVTGLFAASQPVAAPAADLPRADLTIKGQGALSLTCQEDEPCWNWATMGNEKRGVTTHAGRFKVVGPCQFNRLWHTGRIGYRGAHAIPRLRGDGFARTLTDCPWRNRTGTVSRSSWS